MRRGGSNRFSVLNSSWHTSSIQIAIFKMVQSTNVLSSVYFQEGRKKGRENCTKKCKWGRGKRIQACVYNLLTKWLVKTTNLREVAKRKNALILPKLKSWKCLLLRKKKKKEEGRKEEGKGWHYTLLANLSVQLRLKSYFPSQENMTESILSKRALFVKSFSRCCFSPGKCGLSNWWLRKTIFLNFPLSESAWGVSAL